MGIFIDRIPAFQDNYLFLLYDPQSHTAAVVDPGDATPILHRLQQRDLTLTAILCTHHHNDHIGGNRTLLQHYPEAVVYGGAADRGRIPGQTVFLQDGDRFVWGGHTAQVLFVPGHTRAHIAYYFPPDGNGATGDTQPHELDSQSYRSEPYLSESYILGEPGDLFCGDTLFAGGCGRLFEGTPAQLLHSLQRLQSLPPTTRLWCAHEYTLGNLKFALTVDPQNPQLQERFALVQQQRQNHQATIPSNLALEHATNPFLRCHDPAVQAAMGSTDPVKVFTRLRGKKDLF